MKSDIVKLVCLLSCAAVLVSVGEAAQDETDTGSREWGKQSGAFRLSIAADKAEYLPGEPIRISVVLKNVTDHETYLRTWPREMFYQMDVRLPNPEWIPWRPQAALTPLGQSLEHPLMFSVAGVHIPAGRETPAEIRINDLYYMTAPVKYRITFSCKEPLREIADPVVTITSNEVAVTVLPKAR